MLLVRANCKGPLAVATSQYGIDKRVFAHIPLGHLAAHRRVVDHVNVALADPDSTSRRGSG